MTNFEKVKAFQRAFNLPVLKRPTIPADRVELRMSLIAEEMVELREAIEAGDVVAVADALGDLAYVTYGMAAECGIDLDACFAEIHRSNMSKLGADGKPIINDGVMRPDLPVGKVLKPSGWTAPDLTAVLFPPANFDPDQAMEWDADVFARAEMRDGDLTIRPATGTLTKGEGV